MNHLSLQSWGLDAKRYTNTERLHAMGMAFISIALAVACFCLIDVVRLIQFAHHEHLVVYNPSTVLAAFYLCPFGKAV